METEARIKNAFDAVREDRTTFVIAHWLNADKLLVFKAGRIVESGADNEVLRHSGVFTALALQGGLANPADDTKV